MEIIAAKDIPEETLTKIFHGDPLPETKSETQKYGDVIKKHHKNNPSKVNSKKQKVPTKNKPTKNPQK